MAAAMNKLISTYIRYGLLMEVQILPYSGLTIRAMTGYAENGRQYWRVIWRGHTFSQCIAKCTELLEAGANLHINQLLNPPLGVNIYDYGWHSANAEMLVKLSILRATQAAPKTDLNGWYAWRAAQNSSAKNGRE
jgi:hypothetical protein